MSGPEPSPRTPKRPPAEESRRPAAPAAGRASGRRTASAAGSALAGALAPDRSGGRGGLPPRRQRDERQFEDWVAEVTERADPFMAWLGTIFALIVGYELAAPQAPGVGWPLDIAGWTIWGVFLFEFAAKLWLAPRRLRFLRSHWLQAVALAVPALRVLRFLRLLRLGRALPAARVLSASYRTAGTARGLLRSRLGYLAAVSSIAALAIAELELVFERGAAGSAEAFQTLGDALLWSLAVVIALQADPTPVTTGGRIVMLAGFAVGLVVVASLAGSLGAFLVDERRERAEAEARAGAGGDEPREE